MAPWNNEAIDSPPLFTPTATACFTILFMLLILCFTAFLVRIRARQKTRNPQQRRMYVGSRQRPSVTSQEPTIYVSPSNLPPPPKYECLAPPSYEEVVGIHSPNYQVQPITQPISVALAQSSSYTQPENATNPSSNSSPNSSTVPTVTTVNENAPATTSTEPSAVTVVR